MYNPWHTLLTPINGGWFYKDHTVDDITDQQFY